MENKDIRFIDSHYNELFRIEDGRNIIVNVYNGSQKEYTCKYLDDYHFEISGHCYHICEFAELMERNGNTYRPKDAPSYSLEKVSQDEFDYMFAPKDENTNRGCICYIRGYFDNSIDERFTASCMLENRETYQKYHTDDFRRECDNIINYFRFQSDTPILKSRGKMSNYAYDSNAERFVNDKEISGYRITTKDNTYYMRCDARQGQYCLYMYCYNNNEFQKYKDLQFVEKNNTLLDKDKFFFNENGVTEIYYNPDAVAGGQIVCNEISDGLIIEAAKSNRNNDDFYSDLESGCNQYLIDVGTGEFMEQAKHFIESKADFEGCTKKTMTAIKKHAGIETPKHEKDIER